MPALQDDVRDTFRVDLDSKIARELLDKNYRFSKIEQGESLQTTYVYFETTSSVRSLSVDDDITETSGGDCCDDEESAASTFSLRKWDDIDDSESTLSLYGTSKWDNDLREEFSTSSLFDDGREDDDYDDLNDIFSQSMPHLKYLNNNNNATAAAPPQAKRRSCSAISKRKSTSSLKKQQHSQTNTSSSFLKHLNQSKNSIGGSKTKKMKRRQVQIQMMYSNALDVPIVTVQQRFKAQSMEPKITRTSQHTTDINDCYGNNDLPQNNLPCLRHVYSKKKKCPSNEEQSSDNKRYFTIEEWAKNMNMTTITTSAAVEEELCLLTNSSISGDSTRPYEQSSRRSFSRRGSIMGNSTSGRRGSIMGTTTGAPAPAVTRRTSVARTFNMYGKFY